MSKKKKTPISPDPVYDSVVIAKFINRIMERGKKTVAERIVYEAFDEIKKKTKRDPVEVFEQAMQNTSPSLEVRSKRVGGATYQVPVPVGKERKLTLAMRWIIQEAKKRKGETMGKKLAKELMEASENTGKAIKKKNDVHRMAEANRAFAHFAW
jgi:small subunit ribosomal protein S7